MLDGAAPADSGGTLASDVLSKMRLMFKGKPQLSTAPPGVGMPDAPDLLNGLCGRPSGLPPKSAKEASLHAKQIASLSTAARKKAERELELERTTLRAIDSWETEIFPNWEALRDARKTQRMWAQGVPSKVRAELWHRAIGNSLQITEDLYNILRVRGEQVRQSMAVSQQPLNGELAARSVNPETVLARDHDALASIDIDLPRTFPSFQIFKEGPMADSLTGILQAYVQYRPDVGYVQGMSYIVAMMLLHMEQQHVFVSLANLVHQTHLISFFRVIPQEIGEHLRLYDLVFEDALPGLHAHFAAVDLTPQCYVYDWFMTIFSKSLPINIACRIWDLFLLHSSWLHRSAVGLLLHFQRDLMGQSFADCFHLLTHLPKGMQLVSGQLHL
ncbi:Drainin [Diplonema papillatum]|nr:Drainin [Diplonema papillatum]